MLTTKGISTEYKQKEMRTQSKYLLQKYQQNTKKESNGENKEQKGYKLPRKQTVKGQR